ncbi:MAG: CoA transferase [Alphaproteobacteria bacterium]|nr:CoA transferase [Alphaproteobacteria bacterium]
MTTPATSTDVQAHAAAPALSRIKVLDLTRVRAGPTAVRQLADWGADVIQVEAPAAIEDSEPIGGPRHASDFQNLHRNKRAMTLNLKDAEGLAILRRLVATADVLVENFRPDVKHKLGIDYDGLRAVNPRLVYASISGFGQSGPYRARPGVDQVAQGMGGLMSITGQPGQGPMRVGIPIADLTAGLFCAIGILVALVERQSSGVGQWVQASLLQAQIAMLDLQAARWLIDRQVPGQAGNFHPTSIPTGLYPTKDGHINIGGSGGRIFQRFAETLGTSDLGRRPEFASEALRSKNRDALNAIINERTRQKTSAEWVPLLNEAGVPAGPVYSIDQVFADPQVQHLGMAAPVTHPALGPINLVGPGFALSRTPFTMRNSTPERGEHTAAILGELGYNAAEIRRLMAGNVI